MRRAPERPGQLFERRAPAGRASELVVHHEYFFHWDKRAALLLLFRDFTSNMRCEFFADAPRNLILGRVRVRSCREICWGLTIVKSGTLIHSMPEILFLYTDWHSIGRIVRFASNVGKTPF